MILRRQSSGGWTRLWITELEQVNPVHSIKDLVRSSVKVPEFEKHLKKAGGHLGQNVVKITIKIKTIVRKPLMIKIFVNKSHSKYICMNRIVHKITYKWTLTKRPKKKLDGNYTRMLRAILNKSWRQHPTRHQLYGHLPPITKTIQVRRTRHAGHCWRSKDELISDVLLWTPTYGQEKTERPA